MDIKSVVIIGGGLAGSDAAFFLANKGFRVFLYESKRKQRNPAQKTDHLAELVCTNSLKSTAPGSAHGLLKQEMRALESLILTQAQKFSVPAGDALAVDRELFSKGVTGELSNHPFIEIIDEVVTDPYVLKKRHNAAFIIIASGPLTLSGLEKWIEKEICEDDLYFYDAIAPVVDADSLDLGQLYYKDRHKENLGSGDYLNIPLNKAQYEDFVQELIQADKVPAQNFEKETFFESCLPIDVMAQRGIDTLRYSCMKPIGLENSKTDKNYAVIQLRKENLLGSAFNMVGFQNRLTYKEQVRIFRNLPGMKDANFLHLGSVHRNTYLNAAKQLNFDMSAKSNSSIYFAGQISGVEGYTESAAMGLYVASQIVSKVERGESLPWPKETGIGALVNYLMTSPKAVPSNLNFGLLPSVELTKAQRKSKDRKRTKKLLVTQRATDSFEQFHKQWSL